MSLQFLQRADVSYEMFSIPFLQTMNVTYCVKSLQRLNNVSEMNIVIMLFKCTLMKEQINLIKIKTKSNVSPDPNSRSTHVHFNQVVGALIAQPDTNFFVL